MSIQAAYTLVSFHGFTTSFQLAYNLDSLHGFNSLTPQHVSVETRAGNVAAPLLTLLPFALMYFHP